jgi:hypothetical protein
MPYAPVRAERSAKRLFRGLRTRSLLTARIRGRRMISAMPVLALGKSHEDASATFEARRAAATSFRTRQNSTMVLIIKSDAGSSVQLMGRGTDMGPFNHINSVNWTNERLTSPYSSHLFGLISRLVFPLRSRPTSNLYYSKSMRRGVCYVCSGPSAQSGILTGFSPRKKTSG